MALELEQLKKLHDKGYERGQDTREKAADDLIFYWVTQWDEDFLSTSDLAYKGEFNMLRQAGNQILASLQENPIHPDFQPINETRDDAAELLDGMYRKDSHHNNSLEAFQNASAEAVVCGVGAWKLVNEYETNRAGKTNQVIRRYPIYEANNNLIWDPNAKALDKSDADWCSLLVAYSEDGYKELVEELTGEAADSINYSNFKSPEQSYTFPWVNSDKKIYVTEFYHRELVNARSYVVQDVFGNIQVLDADKVDENAEAVMAAGQQIIDERQYERYQVTRYIASGEKILDVAVLPGEEIPIIPQYGYRAFVEGEETYEGVTRIAKDPQRLRNFQLSYLADIVSKTPRPKPIFFPEQIQGFEYMYEEAGADNNYPYYLQNRFDSQGNELPVGVASQMPEQQIPSALAQSIPLTAEAIKDVANAGLPQDIADPDASGKAVLAAQERMDRQTSEYMNKHKFAIRRDAEVYASMVIDVYDTPRTVIIEMPDGTRQEVQTMQMILDDNMNPVIINDLSNAEFEVYATISQAYSTQRQRTKEELVQLMQGAKDAETYNVLLMSYISMIDGETMDDVRDYAKEKLLMMGVRQPESQEEMMKVQQAQMAAQNQPNAELELAKAEQLKGQADLLGAQTDQYEAQTDRMEAMIKRQKLQVDAAKAGVDIQEKQAKTAGYRIDNAMKLRGSVNNHAQRQ